MFIGKIFGDNKIDLMHMSLSASLSTNYLRKWGPLLFILGDTNPATCPFQFQIYTDYFLYLSFGKVLKLTLINLDSVLKCEDYC